MFDFRSNTPISSLNQGQGSVFTLWECAQSILHIELALKLIILEKNFLMESKMLRSDHLATWFSSIAGQ